MSTVVMRQCSSLEGNSINRGGGQMIKIIKLVCKSDRGRRVGQDNFQAKLTNDDAQMIRLLHFEHGMGKQELAKKFEVSRACIRQIISGKSYPEVYHVKRVIIERAER